jgi:glutamate 5-kinase
VRANKLSGMRRVVVKLGSSVVADGDGEPRLEVLARVCDALAREHADGGEVIVVTSGAIARGMRVMDLPQRPSTIKELQAASAVGQGKLYRIYDELLRERDVTSAQVLLTFFDMSARTHYLNARQTLTTLLEWRVLPVINENDTTATDEISFGDNDFLAAQVAVLIAADELILLTDIDGLYTADPRLYPDARIVSEVEDFATLEDLEIGHTTSPLGSGGMRSKVVAADMATAAGIATVICNGLRTGALEAALSGEREGTRFPAREARYSSFKLWLKYAKPSRGTLLIDPGAVRAVREGSASLLPVGVVEVLGDFDAGDAVDIAEQPPAERERARTLGKGICNYSAQELRQVLGMKSQAVREILPRATDEAVHRDYLVVD